MELTIRPYADGDAEGIAAVLGDIDVRFGAHPSIVAVDVGTWMRQVRDPATDTRVVVAPDGSIVAYGAIEPPPDGGVQCGAFGCIHPRWVGRGIGRDLLAWQLERAREMHQALAPSAGWKAWTGTHVDDTDAIRLYQRFGLTPIRYWFQMVAPTANVPAERSASLDGFRVESAEPVDPEVLYEAHMEAFADHFGFERQSFSDWMPSGPGSPLFRPELSRIAYDGDRIAAYILCYDEADPKVLFVGDVGTRRPWRRRGLASGLLIEVLRAGASVDRSEARLGVDAASLTGAVGVYERAGFAVESRRVSYTAEL
ncbi:MAG TPA: GNAT family N-acetyltransferase [Micromonosporaceae bacterium]|jgi:GNAT superfamily N-acetyltransferase